MQEIALSSFGKQIDISILDCDIKEKPMIFKSKHMHSFRCDKDLNLGQAHNVFVVVGAEELERVADFVRQANECKKLKAVMVRQEIYQNWITQLLARADLRTLKNMIVHSGRDIPKRVLQAWQYGMQDQLIADAAVFDSKLFVLDCALKRYEIRFDSIKDLEQIPDKDRCNFIISKEGSHISWTKYDVDLNIDSIQLVVDPLAIQRARITKLAHDKRFGSAIALFRKEKGLLQSQIYGLTDRQVRRIESGDHATVKSLELFAKSHKMNLDKYLNAIANYVHKDMPLHKHSLSQRKV